ncbi:MAG: DUF4968 domain-containing protein [Lachnospiraceae bacterium]|nr:DUF4968 domain-containing protein [Lachnospiraceae bacterium]
METKEWLKKYDYETDGLCAAEAVVQGEKYRISILTPSLVRLEYSADRQFEDRATQAVINRKFPVPEYQVSRENGRLMIETEELCIEYDERTFSAEGLRISVKAVGGAVWRFGQELHDLKGTFRTLDGCNGAAYDGEDIRLGTGVISREGFSVLDDSHSMALREDGWIEPRKEMTDMYFFGYGHRYLQALNDFYHLCGKTPLLPRYTLGNWWSRYYRYTEESYKKLMNRFEEEKLPFTVAVIDMDWHLVDDVDPKYGSGWTGYTWNKKFFPDPERFLDWLHQKRMKVTLNVHPADGVRAYEELYPKVAEAMGIDPATEQAVEFDAADPGFLRVYFDVLCHELEKKGVDFWWLDWQQGTKTKLSGLDPLWVLNHFHYLDSKWKGERPLTFSRYAEVGSHRYPIGFSGDTHITWESLAYQPYFTATASNIGYAWWSHDIGGHFGGGRDDELMARWVQYGVFSPIHRLHSSNNPFAGKEPWRYGAATREVMNRYLRLRHNMIPYLYTMNRRASQENLPLVQPMYYLEPEREETYQVPNEYYFGTELIVSPITTKADLVSGMAKVKTWIPEGLWADFFDGTVYTGGNMVDLWRTIENIPVLMKAGAIIPMRNQQETDNSVENPSAMEVRIFPAADSEFTLWEDQGNTPEDKAENWASTKLYVSTEEHKVVIEGAGGNLAVLPQKRSWKLVFVATGESALKVYSGEEEISAKTYYDEAVNSLIVEIPETDVSEDISVYFVENIHIAGVSSEQRIFAVLEKAQMGYGLKAEIYRALLTDPEQFAGWIRRKEMDENIRESILSQLGECGFDNYRIDEKMVRKTKHSKE